MKSRISILGCGWLGHALAKTLNKSQYKVSASTTTVSRFNDFLNDDLSPYHINIPQDFQEKSDFWNSDTLLISYPPGIRRGYTENFITGINKLAELISKKNFKKILFISSTSVYPSVGSNLQEHETTKDHPLIQAEETLTQNLQNTSSSLYILRCGGLMGYDRYPCKYFKASVPISGSNAPVNYIHRDDVVAIIEKFIREDIEPGPYNLVSDEHPTRRAVLEKCFNEKGETPTFSSKEKRSKTISNEKLKKNTGYSLLFPNPLDFHYDLNERY